MVTPSFLRHSMVAAQSAPLAKFVIVELPLGSAAMIAARCEIDLSPGTLTFPHIRRAGLILIQSIIPTRVRRGTKTFPFVTSHVIGLSAKDPRRKDAKTQNPMRNDK
jgi:hypothetical protein